MRSPRRGKDPWDVAEAVFKPAPAPRPEPAAAPRPAESGLPAPKELVSLRIDQDVLEYFQEGGPGWQDRINAALRKAAGKDAAGKASG